MTKAERVKSVVAGIMVICMIFVGFGAYPFQVIQGEEVQETVSETEILQETVSETEILQETVSETENLQETVSETEIPEETTSEVETPPDYKLSANTGYTKEAPDNSMPALKLAMEKNYRGIKVDLRRCKPDADGNAKWVAGSSDFLNESMGINLKISNATYEELLQYSYITEEGKPAYSENELRIVSLEEIIDLMKECKEKELDLTWQFDIKISTDSSYDSYLEEILTLLKEADVQELAEFGSYDYSYLKKIKEIDSTFFVWFWGTKLDDMTMHYASLCHADGICFKGNSPNNTMEAFNKAVESGYALSVYNADDTTLMGTYYKLGVKNFVTSKLEYADIVSDELEKTYDINELTCTLSQEAYAYNGGETLPEVVLTYNDNELYEGMNYPLSYENTITPGTATIKITGINNCVGEREVTYKIEVPKVTELQITSLQATYAKLSWKKVSIASGYVVYWHNKTTGEYEEIKTIKDAETVSCKVKNLTSGIKHKFKIKTYVTLEDITYDSETTAAVSGYTKPAKATVKSALRYHSGERIRVKWKKQTNCSGYQIKIATNKAMTKVIGNYTVSGKTKTKLKIKKLSSKKTYYIKVRAYLKVGKEKKYGAYSEILKNAGKK